MIQIIPQSTVQSEIDSGWWLIPPHKKQQKRLPDLVCHATMASVADKGTKALQHHRGIIHGLWELVYPPCHISGFLFLWGNYPIFFFQNGYSSVIGKCHFLMDDFGVPSPKLMGVGTRLSSWAEDRWWFTNPMDRKNWEAWSEKVQWRDR